jgi:hypothetical protein
LPRDLDPRHRKLWSVMMDLPAWLVTKGYLDAEHTLADRDSAAAVEARETGPDGLEDLLRERAAIAYYHEVYDWVGTINVPPKWVVEFAGLRDKVSGNPQAPWAELMPALQDLALRLRRLQGRDTNGPPTAAASPADG